MAVLNSRPGQFPNRPLPDPNIFAGPPVGVGARSGVRLDRNRWSLFSMSTPFPIRCSDSSHSAKTAPASPMLHTWIAGGALLVLLVGCSGKSSTEDKRVIATAESCMSCHNGSAHDDYAGGGLENPHPFPGAASLKCTECHGGDPYSHNPDQAHVPPPPEVGDEAFQENNAEAYFNRLTLTGLDRYPDYEVHGVTYSALDYLQFVNPGDLRVAERGRSCGQCHMAHVECVTKSPLATETGIFSGAMYAIGVENAVPANRNRFEHTAADLAFRAVADADHVHDDADVGSVKRLFEFPVHSVHGEVADDQIFENPNYAAHLLPAGQLPDGRVVTDSPLAHLYHEQVAFTCGDCHLGSAGANNRYGDFRSSGCTACHMRYSLDGRSRSTDLNIQKFEPLDPDDIDAPERPHVDRHLIRSVARTLATGETVHGMDDYTCAGCHQGSNRTVMQFWGIRLDQNQDVRRGHQYPANPVSFTTTADDERLFDPHVANNTFNGRNANQYLLHEDYDGDGRDDTPEDVHYQAGMGCIDCHGSHDVHGGTVGDPASGRIHSRQEQAVAIRCESCHGTVDAYAGTVDGVTYDGTPAKIAVDIEGNPLPHVVQESDGSFFLTSRLTGNRHFLPQTRDVVVDSGRVDPFTNEPVYSTKGSYAMGRVDGDAGTGLGPQQHGGVPHGFSHMDNVSCAACHSSWTNNCIGCHLSGEYDTGGNFSNITGERIVFEQENADFVYQSPLFFQMGVDADGKIAPIAPNTDVFWSWVDSEKQRSKIFTFSDRNGQGSNTNIASHPSLSHNVMLPHSIRGKIDDTREGPRYCNACHLTDSGLTLHRAEYDSFRAALASGTYSALDFDVLLQHFGNNTNNTLDSPLWVHAAAGLGSGLFLFDENGCAVNPIDDNDNRVGCDGLSPADRFDILSARFDLDKIVDPFGVSTASSNHLLLSNTPSPLRDGANDPEFSGPLGATLLLRLTDPDTGIVLDSWLDSDGAVQGNAGDYVDE